MAAAAAAQQLNVKHKPSGYKNSKVTNQGSRRDSVGGSYVEKNRG